MFEEPDFNLIQILEERIPLIGDGGVGTLLRSFGLEERFPAIQANLEQPELVKRMHQAYLRKGTRLIRTNSILPKGEQWSSIENRLEALINSASALAREVSNNRAVVAGRITGAPEEWSAEAKYQLYGEQAVYFSDTKVDLIWLEQFTSCKELLLALRAVRQVSAVQTVAHLSLEPGRTSLDLTEELKHLMNSGATFVGVMIDSPEFLQETLLQELIDELGILSLVLDLVLDQEKFPDLKEVFRKNIPSETALICGGQNFLPDHIHDLSIMHEGR